jgi:hypothetical protein
VFSFFGQEKGEPAVYQSVLADVQLFELLGRIDQDLAREVQGRGCGWCGGRLDRADYARKPRGVAPGLGAEHARRLSLCCAAEGCRRRSTPPSVRFLGRRVYVGAAILGITALRPGARHAERRALRTWLGVSARTLVRWRRWWRATFAQSAFWRRARGRLRTPVPAGALPGGLLRRFAGDRQARLVAALRFLAPITTATAAM